MNVSVNTISLVDADSYWIDGYFEETNLAPIRVDDSARIKLMSYSQIVRGHVDSIARAIDVSNAQPDRQGVATVNPKIRSRFAVHDFWGVDLATRHPPPR